MYRPASNRLGFHSTVFISLSSFSTVGNSELLMLSLYAFLHQAIYLSLCEANSHVEPSSPSTYQETATSTASSGFLLSQCSSTASVSCFSPLTTIPACQARMHTRPLSCTSLRPLDVMISPLG